jgi:hypothetical protein
MNSSAHSTSEPSLLTHPERTVQEADEREEGKSKLFGAPRRHVAPPVRTSVRAGQFNGRNFN